MIEAPLRVAIAGAGMVARLHLDAARRAGARVVGVCASTPERGKAAAERFGLERSFDSAEELVAGDAADVVHICTPNASHFPLAELALRAGKHVICEKPLATAGDEADALVELARDSGLIAAVPFVYRYHPMAAEARARVRGGFVGDVRLIHGHYLQDWLSEPSDNNWRVDPRQGGASRAFADIGSHWCDLVEWVSGHRISELIAEAQTVLPVRYGSGRVTFTAAGSSAGEDEPRGTAVTTEDAVQVLFRTDRGASGTLTVSQVSPGRKNRLWFEIDGAGASLAFDQENPESLFAGSRAGNARLLRDSTLLSPEAARLSVLPPGHPMGYADCFAGFVADVFAAIRAGSSTVRDCAPAFPTFGDAARTVRLTEAVLRSARSRSWIEVPR
ncbi:MAG TPA: Gfo/Idh/MocA family oxidoreductase [Actinocrinis sp.]|nr:Gfo/Idh/MocA family oxidoreductase [Actinocrinis sp.]